MLSAATDPLAQLRAKFAALEARAAAREARDAEREAQAPKARPVREVDPDALTSRATLAADAELADRPQVAYRGATVAPEFADHDPDAPAHELDGDCPPSVAVPAAPESPTPAAVNNAAGDPGAATHGVARPMPARLPNAAWSDATRARAARMEAFMLVARLAGSNVIRGPWDGLTRPVEPEPMPAARSARGPPG